MIEGIILLVEDDESIARFVELELTHNGFEVRRVTNGTAALDSVEADCPDLVVRLGRLHVEMPALNSVHIVRELFDRPAGRSSKKKNSPRRSEHQQDSTKGEYSAFYDNQRLLQRFLEESDIQRTENFLFGGVDMAESASLMAVAAFIRVAPATTSGPGASATVRSARAPPTSATFTTLPPERRRSGRSAAGETSSARLEARSGSDPPASSRNVRRCSRVREFMEADLSVQGRWEEIHSEPWPRFVFDARNDRMSFKKGRFV